MDDKILFLYAQGMTRREICTVFKELYDADVSASLISKITNSVMEQGVEWQARPLDRVYPIVYLDCLVVKIRQDKQVISKAIYTTNAIESLSSVIRTAIKKRKLFPHDDAAKKGVYLAKGPTGFRFYSGANCRTHET